MHAFWPRTRLGWWAFVLAMTSIGLFALNRIIMPLMETQSWYYGVLSMYEVTTTLCGLSGGVCALVAWIGGYDTSWAVRVSLIPLCVFIGGLISLVVV
jgi:hypothetical protein